MNKKIICAAAIAAGSTCAATMLGGLYIFNTAMLRTASMPKRKSQPVNTEMEEDYKEYNAEAEKGREYLKSKYTERLSIISDDGKKLYALHSPCLEKDNKKYVVCVHGYRSNGMNDFAMLSEYLLSLGYGILIPDNRAHGESEGKYIGFGWNERMDCLKWCKYLADKYGKDTEIALYGLSMGAAAVMDAAGEETIPQIKCIIEDCGFSSAWDELSLQLKNSFGLKPFPLLYSASIWNKIFNGSFLSENNAMKQLKKSKLPILFIHGENDRYVPVEMGKRLYESYSGPKMLYIAPNAGHAQSYIKNKTEYKRKLSEFFDITMSKNSIDSESDDEITAQ